MKNKNVYIKNIVKATFTTILLIYFMIKTTSNKIIFVPFLICGFSMVGKNIALILEKKKYANIFSKIFIVGFLLFWFGFLYFIYIWNSDVVLWDKRDIWNKQL